MLIIQYENEWEIDPGFTQNYVAFQGLTTDARYVYLLSGNKSKDPKIIYINEFKGNLFKKMDPVSLGHFDCLSSQAI